MLSRRSEKVRSTSRISTRSQLVGASFGCSVPVRQTEPGASSYARQQAKPTYSYWRSEMYVLPSWISSRSSVWWRSCL